MGWAIATIFIASSAGRPAKACIQLRGVGCLLQKEQLRDSGPMLPPERGEEQARDPEVVLLALPGERACMARQAGGLVAGFERHRLQCFFERALVLAAEDLEGAVRVPVAVRPGPADLSVAAAGSAFARRRGIGGQVKAVDRPPDPFHVALPELLLFGRECAARTAGSWSGFTSLLQARGAVLHASSVHDLAWGQGRISVANLSDTSRASGCQEAAVRSWRAACASQLRAARTVSRKASALCSSHWRSSADRACPRTRGVRSLRTSRITRSISPVACAGVDSSTRRSLWPGLLGTWQVLHCASRICSARSRYCRSSATRYGLSARYWPSNSVTAGWVRPEASVQSHWPSKRCATACTGCSSG